MAFTFTLLTSPELREIKNPIELRKLEDEAKAKQQEKEKERLQKEKERRESMLASQDSQDGDTTFGGVDNPNASQASVGSSDVATTPAKSKTSTTSFSLTPISMTLARPLFFTVLVIAPVNTIQNWKDEYDKWTKGVGEDVRPPVRLITATDSTPERRKKEIREWHENGGVLIMGYDMFRNLTFDPNSERSLQREQAKLAKEARKSSVGLSGLAGGAGGGAGVGEEPTSARSKSSARGKKNQRSADDIDKMQKWLVEPGPDLVVADEAHTIKDKKSRINEALCQIGKSALHVAQSHRYVDTPLVGKTHDRNLYHYCFCPQLTLIESVLPFFVNPYSYEAQDCSHRIAPAE